MRLKKIMLPMDNNKLSIYRGDDGSFPFTITDPDTGLPVNLTAYTVFFTVKAAKNSTAAGSLDTTAVIGPKKNAPGGHTSPTAGVTTFTLTNLETAVTPGTYYYDVEYVSGTSVVKTFVVGEFVIVPEVTTKIS